MPPVFYIVMGPNGAGKSTFGSLYTQNVVVYDPDKRKMEITAFLSGLDEQERKRLYPAYSKYMFEDLFDSLVSDYQQEEYANLQKFCIEKTLDFALETPFADNFSLNEVLLFKKEGYIIQGIFFGLNTVEQSIANVSMRVQKKGHDLPTQSIDWNFGQCYINVHKHLELFDNLLLIDAQNPLNAPTTVGSYSAGQLSLRTRPAWIHFLFGKI